MLWLIGHLYFRWQHLLARPAALQRTSAGTRFIVTPLPDVDDTVRIHDTKTSLTWIEHCDFLASTDHPEALLDFRARQRRHYIPEALISKPLLNS